MGLHKMPKGRTLEGIAYGDDEHAQISFADNGRTHRDPRHAVTVSVDRGETDWEGRTVYQWEIVGSTSSGPVYGKGEDLATGVDMDSGACDMLGALLGFLGACAESVNYGGGENADLFSANVAEWAAQHSDEIGIAEFELTN